MGYRKLRVDGGAVEYLVSGPPDAGELLIFHVGTPSAAVEYPGLTRAAAAAGMRVAAYSRGGYGASTRLPGRTVAHEAANTAALADHLGHQHFATIGWSGGGPVALACAALLPERVRACVLLASPAPRVEAGAAWEAWTPEAERAEWAVLAGDDQGAMIHEYEDAVRTFARATPRRLRAIGGPPDDRAIALNAAAEIDAHLVRSMRRAVSRGYFGFLDDNIAQARDWGFRVADIRVPVVVRQGDRDRLVNAANGRWLASAIPGARPVLLPDAGHGSIALPWSDVIADVVRAAASRGPRIPV